MNIPYPHIFRALKHRNYRLFFVGQGVSLIGTWMQQIGEIWLAYRLTDSAFYLGVVGFASQAPIFFIAPLAGVWADRMNRRTLLIITQSLEMVQAFLLAALTVSHQITLTWLIVLSVLGGIVDAFDIPTRQSFVVRMVDDPADLGNAIALNSSLVNLARLLGPSIAGIVIAGVGEGWCFFINGFSYLAVLISLGMMQIDDSAAGRAAPPSVARQLWNGLSYILHSPTICILLGLLASLSLVTSVNSVLAPIFATKVLGGDAHTLGFLMAGSGFGALAAALTLAARRSVLGLTRWIGASAVLLGASLLVYSASQQIWLSCLMLTGAGFGMMCSGASINTVLQTIVEEKKRGRVMSFFAAAFIGMAPLGNILGGWMADRFGVVWTVRGSGLFCLACAGVYLSARPFLRNQIRPIYTQLGILPPVADGLRAVTPVKR